MSKTLSAVGLVLRTLHKVGHNLNRIKLHVAVRYNKLQFVFEQGVSVFRRRQLSESAGRRLGGEFGSLAGSLGVVVRAVMELPVEFSRVEVSDELLELARRFYMSVIRKEVHVPEAIDGYQG